MLTQQEHDEIREEILQELLIERADEMRREQRLFEDEEFAFEELVDSGLIDVYDTLNELAISMNSYGWNIQVQELVRRLKSV